MENKQSRITNNKTLLACCIGMLTSLSIQPALAQSNTSLQQIRQIEMEKIEAGAQTQIKIENIDDERMKLANEYRVTLKQNTNLKKYNGQLEKTILSQEAEIQSLEQQINRVSGLERDIVPLMSDMLDALEEFVALDVPFLQEERMQRIERLKALMTDGNVSNSERYRRVLEAYQIENDYGRTIEAYDGELSSNGQTVTFLKIGRVAFLYQTLDKSESYRWSVSKRRWEKLEDGLNSNIDEGIKMAREQIPSNLLFAPIEISLSAVTK